MSPMPLELQTSLRITSLELRSFRSYSHYTLTDLGSLTIFVGQNGIGKTNILESLALMTSTRSFRHAQILQLIKEGETAARITAELTDGNRLLQQELVLEPGKKRYVSNGKAKRTQDMQGILPAVAFTPDDLNLAKGSSSIKRDAFDDLGMQLTTNYSVVRRDYEKVLRYKNRLLKEEAPAALVDSINETLLTCGSQLYCYRTSLVSRLLPLIAQNYAQIAGVGAEEFSAVYQPSWDYLAQGEPAARDALETLAGTDASWAALSRDDVRTLLADALEKFGSQEVARKRALVGPHNDKIYFYLGGRDAANYASQGQQRSLVLAWKLAEVQFVRQSLGTYPVLLLDDVMSELDASRRDMLVRFVTDDIQTFITATDLSAFNDSLLDRARIITL